MLKLQYPIISVFNSRYNYIFELEFVFCRYFLSSFYTCFGANPPTRLLFLRVSYLDGAKFPILYCRFIQQDPFHGYHILRVTDLIRRPRKNDVTRQKRTKEVRGVSVDSNPTSSQAEVVSNLTLLLFQPELILIYFHITDFS